VTFSDPESYLGKKGSSCYTQLDNRKETSPKMPVDFKHKCQFCKKNFKYPCHLKVHMAVHTRENPFKCSQCDKTYAEKCKLKRHVNYFHQTTSGLCKFPNCGKIYASESSLRYHSYVHYPNSVMNSLVPCPICKAKFKKLRIHDHIRLQHKAEKKQCDECHKVFSRSDYLKEHKLTAHTHTVAARPVFPCQFCKKIYSKKRGLKEHIRATHSGNPKSYQCTFCQKTLTKATGLRIHMSMHTGEKPYSCSICDRNFANTNSLKYHFKVHHPAEKMYECTLCEEAFSMTVGLNDHMKMHENQRNEEADSGNVLDNFKHCKEYLRYKCPLCTKSFHWNWELQNHAKSHLKEKPFVCNKCPKTFTHKSTLNRHLINIHECTFQTQELDKSNDNSNNELVKFSIKDDLTVRFNCRPCVVQLEKISVTRMS